MKTNGAIVARIILIAAAWLGSGAYGQEKDMETGQKPDPHERRNIIVFKEEGRYGGWPANHGLWAWGNEIVVGFTAAHYKPARNDHAVDRSKPFEDWQARSLDGGKTWTIEKPPGIVPMNLGGPAVSALKTPLDFTHADFALMFRLGGIHTGPSRFYASTDRCRTWSGPFAFEVEGIDKIATRTDYLAIGPLECLMFGSAAKADNKEGRLFCARTDDGGLRWRLVSLIGPEPAGYLIMPSSVRLAENRILTTARHKDPQRPGTIDAYLSEDDGANWKFIGEAASNIGGGNPPSLIALRDGRLCLTYGCRARPFGIRARLSRDQGATWGEEIVLRDDGPTGDLGYPRSVQRPDGRVVTVYYFNGPADEDRAIEATIWRP